MKQSGLKLEKVFDQYLRTTLVPVLEYKIENDKLSYRWTSCVKGFDMPLKVTLKDQSFSSIYPTTAWKTTGLSSQINKGNFKADPNFYVKIKNL